MDIALYVTFLLFLITANISRCNSTLRCSVKLNSTETMEVQCFSISLDLTLTLEHNVLTVQCLNKNVLNYLNTTTIPFMDTKNVNYLFVKYCTNTSAEILESKFNLSNIKTVEIDGSQIESLHVEKDMFKNLEMLKICNTDLDLTDDVLSSTPNLKTFKLFKNNFKAMGYIFNNSKKLTNLEIKRNRIYHFQKEIFLHLKNLKTLTLFRNNLKKIDKEVLNGIENVEIIDLSANDLTVLDSDVFSNLKQLTGIYLQFNNLSCNISDDIFRNNSNLVEVNFGYNPDLRFSNNVFSNKSKLSIIKLSNCRLFTLPQTIFHGSFNIQHIDLSKNNFNVIPDKLFLGLQNLTKINLAHNNISFLTKDIFASLNSLCELNLKRNAFRTIGSDQFGALPTLETLNLEHNRIMSIEENAFIGLLNLKKLFLKNNTISVWRNDKNELKNIEVIDLSFNYLTRFPKELVGISFDITNINLKHNFIDELEFNELNRSSPRHVLVIDLSRQEKLYHLKAQYLLENPIINTTLVLDHNIIECDCYLYDFILFNQIKLTNQNGLNIIQNNFTCSNKKSQVKLVQLSSVTCTPDYGCPQNCSCDWKRYDSSMNINCSNRNLTEIPKIRHAQLLYNTYRYEFNFNQTIVNLSRNAITNGPKEDSGYENVTKLILSNNWLNQFTWIPPKIEEINLENNKLKVLHENTISLFKKSSSLKSISLAENPWTCNCEAVDLKNYVNNYVVNRSAILCVDTLKSLTETDVCPTSFVPVIAGGIILVFLLILASMLAMFYRDQDKIRIYLYDKGLCLCWLSKDDLDNDKKYDVFICFPHQVEEFIVKHLLPGLESGPRRYKTCIHVRDFMPGESITQQVITSIQDSRRTLVVLSKDFVDSEYCLMEFRTAYAQNTPDGRSRLIVVVYGDLDEIKLTDELKLYVDTNTYVKWGDPWFWKKLRFALRHSQLHKQKTMNRKDHFTNSNLEVVKQLAVSKLAPSSEHKLSAKYDKGVTVPLLVPHCESPKSSGDANIRVNIEDSSFTTNVLAPMCEDLDDPDKANIRDTMVPIQLDPQCEPLEGSDVALT